MAHCTQHHIRSGTEYVGDIFDEPCPHRICPLTTDSPCETMASALRGGIAAPLLTIQQWPAALLTLHSHLENLVQWKIIKLLKPAVCLWAFAKKHKSEIFCIWKTPNVSYRFLCVLCEGLKDSWAPYVVYHHLKQRHMSNGVCGSVQDLLCVCWSVYMLHGSWMFCSGYNTSRLQNRW